MSVRWDMGDDRAGAEVRWKGKEKETKTNTYPYYPNEYVVVHPPVQQNPDDIEASQTASYESSPSPPL